MSKETKLGLLISLGVILAFAMIISLRLGNEGYADLGDRYNGADDTARTVRTRGSDLLDREAGFRDVAQRDGGAVPADRAGENPVADERLAPGDDDTRIVIAQGPEDLRIADNRVVTPERDGETGAEPVAQVPAEAPALPVVRPYTVKAGDRLYRIAETFYGPGKGYQWRKIVAANPGVNPESLQPGTVLTIPPLTPSMPRVAAAESSAPVAPPGRETTTSPRVYMVVSGDTLGHISQKTYGTYRKWKRIQEANPGVAPESLRVGQKLVIPALADSAVARSDDQATDAARAVEVAIDQVRDFVERDTTRTPYSPYTVARGDSLTSISRRHFGDGRRWRDIYELNRDQLPDPDAVRVGQVLRIPATTQTAMVIR